MAEGLALEDGVCSYERTRVGGSSPHLRCQGSVCRPRATKSTLRIQETCSVLRIGWQFHPYPPRGQSVGEMSGTAAAVGGVGDS